VQPTARLAVVILCLTAACGDGGGDGARAAGDLVAVLNSQVTVDGRRAAGGDLLNVGSVLTTDGTGVATFRLRGKPSDCQVQPNSALRLLAGPGPIIDFQRGASVCSAGAEGGEALEVSAGGTRVELRGVVTLDPGAGEVRTLKGSAEMKDGTGKTIQRVLEGTLARLGRPSDPARRYDPGRLDPLEKEAAARLGARVADGTTTSRPTTTAKPTTTSSTQRPKTTTTTVD
jgi:hypothetical protein